MKQLITILLVSCSSLIVGQDLHFSQFFTNQMALNPAFTGLYDEDFGASIIYRTQWGEIDSRFENLAFSADFNKEIGNNKLGIGVLVLKDKLPFNVYTLNSAALNLSYQHYLDLPKKHLISIGSNIGWTAKTFHADRGFEFGNQYIDFQFDAAQPNNEDLNTRTLNSVNVDAGANYTWTPSSKVKVNTGANFLSLTTPNESFISSKNTNQLGVRYVAYVMADYELDAQTTLSPKVLYMNQSRGRDLNLGFLMTYKMSTNVTAELGAFYRVQDAGIVVIGLGWKSILLRGSMDTTSSSLEDVGEISDSGYNTPRSYEIGIIYRGILKKHSKTNLTVPCGIF